MSKETIESLFFQNKTKDQLIEDTLTSLSALLADTFAGEDVNQLKSEFPEKIQIEDIGVELHHVAIYVESKEMKTPCVEVAINMVFERQEYELGTYALIFDEKGEQIDEILNLE